MEHIVHPHHSTRWLCEQGASRVQAKWAENNPQLVLIQDFSIASKIQRLYEKATQVSINKVTAKSKKAFYTNLDHLFDILVCQCPIDTCSLSDCLPAHCLVGAHIRCSCLKEFKISSMELPFIKDQREKIGLKGWAMQMAGADKVEAMRVEKLLKRKGEGAESSGTQVTSEDDSGSVSQNYIEDNNNENGEIEGSSFSTGSQTVSYQNRTDLSA